MEVFVADPSWEGTFWEHLAMVYERKPTVEEMLEGAVIQWTGGPGR